MAPDSNMAQSVVVCEAVDEPFVSFEDVKVQKRPSTVSSRSSTHFPHVCEGNSALKTRCICCLLEAHKKDIATLRSTVEDVLLPENDDLWLLRYLLSFKTQEEAASAIVLGQKWRRENAELIADVRRGVPEKSDEIMSKYLASSLHKQARDGSPIYITRIGLTNPKAVSSKLSEDDICRWMMYNKEKCYLICDGLTRSTGLLMKSINVIDFAHTGTRLLTARDKKVEKCLNETSGLGEHLYPQLVHQNILFNVPSAFKWVISCVKTVMPKKMAEKVVCCPARTDSRKAGSCVGEECAYISETFNIQQLPTFLGGKCSCSNGCVFGTGNDQTSYSS